MKKDDKKSNKLRVLKTMANAAAIIIFILAGVYFFKDKTISYNQFVSYMDDEQVESIVVSGNKDYLKVRLNDGKVYSVINPNTDKSNEYLYGSNVNIKKQTDYVQKGSTALTLIFSVVCICVLIKFVFGKSNLKIAMPGPSKLDTRSRRSSVVFDDIAGNEESKEQMQDLVSYLREPAKFKEYGVKPPKGVIFYGPPGTGKTLLAKALAGEAGCDFISVNGADFVDKFVGNGASRVRELFQEARTKKPCIIFIDEIDAIGGERNSSTHEERHQTLNSLLGEMDGFRDDEEIIIIAATNRLDTLDQALLRSGRFDTKIRIGLPDVKAREKIFKVHSRNKPIAEDVDFKYFAKITTYFSGADIENIMNKAGMYAIKERVQLINSSHINKAINVQIAGDEKKDRSAILEKDKMLTAVHEVGHALVAKKFAELEVNKITIIPTTSGAGGYTLLNEEEVSFKSKTDLYKRIAVSLGGRAAEEVIYGKDNITTGAAQDIKNVTNILENMIKVYGMSDKFGMLNLERYSGLTKSIAEEGKDISEKIYKDVIGFLNDNKALLEYVSSKLVEVETLDDNEFNDLLKDFK